VIVVDAAYPPFETYGLKEAVQVSYDASDEVPENQLLANVLDLLRPASLCFEEKRSHVDWGATGPFVQEILVQFGAVTVAGLTIEGVLAGLRKLFRNGKREAVGNAIEIVPPASIAEVAWEVFARFLEIAFKVSRTRAIEVTDRANEWRIRATGDGYRYEGTVSKDGRVMHARRVDH